MRYRKLGRTDMEVSVVCLGCWAFSGDFAWGPQQEKDSIAAVHAALDAGVNFFDNAEAYGNGLCEEVLAKALGNRRKDVIIATKASRRNLTAERLKASCEASLRRLKTDVIDLYQAHFPNKEVPLDETFEAMEQLKAEGKIRAIGVSNFGVSFLNELLPAHEIASNQVAYSLLWRAIEHEILPLCRAHDVGILPYSPLCQGLLTGKFASPEAVPDGRARSRLFSKDRPLSRHSEPGCEKETFEAIDRIREICESIGQPMGQVALAWLLAQDGVTSVIAGARNAEQAAENAKAGDLQLDADVLARLDEATRQVKEIIGPNADMWQTDSRLDR